MNTLELLRELHNAIGNTYPDFSTVPVKLAVLLPELRVEIRRRELKQNENELIYKNHETSYIEHLKIKELN